MSPHVTIHKTPLEKAQSVYDNHAGELIRPTYTAKPHETVFEHHDLILKCEDWELANYDISISGLGWVSISGKGIAQMRLHIPKNIKHTIRDPLMPFEVQDKGLNKYTGNTVNVNSKKNVKGREKWKVRQEFVE